MDGDWSEMGKLLTVGLCMDLAEILGRNRDVMIGRKTTACMIWI